MRWKVRTEITGSIFNGIDREPPHRKTNRRGGSFLSIAVLPEQFCQGGPARPVLPDPQYPLQHQADARDPDPAAGAHKDRFPPCFDQLDQISVKSDGSHGQHDKEFAQFFDRLEDSHGHAGLEGNGGYDGSGHKVQDEKWEDIW